MNATDGMNMYREEGIAYRLIDDRQNIRYVAAWTLPHALARQKQPALARSESHDVGHAEGIGETHSGNKKRLINEFADKIFDNLKRESGA